jgi:tetratricopeptide (TPR) repeat protein
MADYRKTVQYRFRVFVYVAVLALVVPLSAQSQPPGRVRIAIPGVPGALEINVGSTTVDQDVSEDGREVRLTAIHRADGLLLTASLQKVSFPASAERCRSEWWPQTKKGAKIRREELNESDFKDGIARVEFIVPEYNGARLRQKNIHAYVGGGNLCAEVHLSKVEFTPQDQSLFENVLATVRLLPDEPPTHPEVVSPATINQSLGEAGKSYLRKDYKNAAVLYQKVLDVEKYHRTLNQTLFRVLVDNLGMSYGLRSEWAKAKETFEYGIKQDPEYPLFYYNMACTYAETGKLDASLEQLRLAYKFRNNVIPGELFPDPMTDSSFRKFVKNPGFVQAVHEMQGQ